MNDKKTPSRWPESKDWSRFPACLHKSEDQRTIQTKEHKPPIVNQQNVVCFHKGGLCYTGPGFTSRHLHQRVEEHKRSTNRRPRKGWVGKGSGEFIEASSGFWKTVRVNSTAWYLKCSLSVNLNQNWTNSVTRSARSYLSLSFMSQFSFGCIVSMQIFKSF